MSARPVNGRGRSNHSVSGAIFVGAVIAAFSVVVFITLGGAQP